MLRSAQGQSRSVAELGTNSEVAAAAAVAEAAVALSAMAAVERWVEPMLDPFQHSRGLLMLHHRTS